MYVKRSKEERLKLLADVDALVASGKSFEAALGSVSIHRHSYFNWKKRYGNVAEVSPPKEKRKRIPSYQRIEVPSPVSEETITLTKSKFFELLQVLAK